MVNSPTKSKLKNELFHDIIDVDADGIDIISLSKNKAKSKKIQNFVFDSSDENLERVEIVDPDGDNSPPIRRPITRSQKHLNCWISKKTPKPLNFTINKNTKQSTIDFKPMGATTSKRTTDPPIHGKSNIKNSELSVLKKKYKQPDLFRKFDCKLPTATEIKSEEKKLEEYVAQINEALEMDDIDPLVSPEKKDQKNNDTWLDCKYITLNEISEHFESNRSFLKNIFIGQTDCLEHKIHFSKNTNHRGGTLMSELTCHPSSSVFTYEQLAHMCSLMEKEFQTEGDRIVYFFQVLIPQFCLKIFRERHNMSELEAIRYLEDRPLD